MRSFTFALAVAVLVAISTLVSAGVVELNTANYEEVTGAAGKNVMVMVYATWCGHCTSLKPEYEKVAETFASNENIVIAKFDAPANEDYARNTLQIRSFPTLFFYKSGVKTDYAGARSGQGIEEFINAQL